MNTSELRQVLGVSRGWINTHLRHLGGEVMQDGNKRAVPYDYKEVLAWANENAVFTRQVVPLDLTKYAAEDEVEEKMDAIDNMPKNTIAQQEAREEAYDAFLQKILPEEIYESVSSGWGRRNRGLLPWERIEYEIEELDELCSIRDLMRHWGYRNEEMAYREIFALCMVRCEVKGRVWFIYPREGMPKYGIQIPVKLAKS